MQEQTSQNTQQQQTNEDLHQSTDIQKQESLTKDLIYKLQKSGSKVVLHVSGCGSQALKDFTQYPGSSAFALEARNLYGMGGAIQINQGSMPEKFVSQEMADVFATQALLQAHKIINTELSFDENAYNNNIWSKCIGIGVTGGIRSAQPKKGKHQCYISIISTKARMGIYLNLEKEARTREEEDALISYKVWQLISYQSGILKNTSGIELDFIRQNDQIQILFEEQNLGPSYFFSLPICSSLTYYNLNNFAINLVHSQCVMLSGSFNPLHEGHLKMLKHGTQFLQYNPKRQFFEIAIKNADKGVIDFEEVGNRIKYIFSKDEQENNIKVILSNKTLFSQKTEFLKNSAMLLGIDTLKRLVDKKYYDNSEENKIIALSEFRRSNITFISYPRLNDSTQKVEKIDNYKNNVPVFLQEKIHEIDDFRMDVSSSKIRKEQQQQQQ